MKITKKHFLSLLVLIVIFLAQIILINNINIVQASNLWDLAEEGGLEEIGDTAYGQSGDPTDIRTVVAKVVNVFLTFLGIIFFVIIVVAGYKWMMSGGNEETVKAAKKQITTGTIGLLIILLAWSITYFIMRHFQQIIDDSTWLP